MSAKSSLLLFSAAAFMVFSAFVTVRPPHQVTGIVGTFCKQTGTPPAMTLQTVVSLNLASSNITDFGGTNALYVFKDASGNVVETVQKVIGANPQQVVVTKLLTGHSYGVTAYGPSTLPPYTDRIEQTFTTDFPCKSKSPGTHVSHSSTGHGGAKN